MPRWQLHFHSTVDLQDPDVTRLVARIESLTGLIHEIPLPPTLRLQIDRLNIVRAVRGTTGIEGSDLTEDEVEQVLRAEDARRAPVLGTARAREEQEARNARRVMEFIRSTVRGEPDHLLTESDVREIHRLTTSAIDYRMNAPGEYREHPVVAGDYLAPVPSEVPDLMGRFFEWFPETRERDGWPECVRAVAAHFYLISIHPFGDGNGRTSRAVESLILYRSGINSLGFYSLANFYYRHRAEYEEQLNRARFVHDGDLTELVTFALRGLREELDGVHAQALAELRKVAFRDFAREQLQVDGGLRTKVGERRLQLVLLALAEPIPLADVRSRRHPASALYQGTSRTLNRDLSYLEEAGLLVVTAGRIEPNLAIMSRFIE